MTDPLSVPAQRALASRSGLRRLAGVRRLGALALGLALLLGAPLARAAGCQYPISVYGEDYDLSWAFASAAWISASACAKGKDYGALSPQELLDNIPEYAVQADGSRLRQWNPEGVISYLRAQGGLCTLASYPIRYVRLAYANLGDAAADTDSFEFSGTAGSNVVIRLTAVGTPERAGDALLTLTGPGGAAVVGTARGFLPVELKAVLPAAGSYRLSVSQRPGSERSFSGKYRLLLKGAEGAIAGLADVENGTFRLTVDREFTQAAPVGAWRAPVVPTRVMGLVAPGGPGLLSLLRLNPVLFRLNVGKAGVMYPSFRVYKAGVFTMPDGDDSVTIWVMAVGFQGTPAIISFDAGMGAAWGEAGICRMASSDLGYVGVDAQAYVVDRFQ